MKKSRKKFNKTLLFLFVLFFSILIINLNCIEARNKKVTFIAFGHTYPDYESLDLSIPLIEEENPDFVVFLGDSISGIPDKPASSLLPIIEKIEVPVYFVPGNHDLSSYEGVRESFTSDITNILYQNFTIGDNTFIILNSVTPKLNEYDISDEQVAFLEEIYEDPENVENSKFILMHHCLFYQDNERLCNYRGTIISKDSNWNSVIVPLIQDTQTSVFVGDLGGTDPYFAYEEDNIKYFGVGFSENILTLPQHFLKVEIDGDELTVTPVSVRQDLTKENYIPPPVTFYSTVSDFVHRHLRPLVISLSIAVVLLGLILFIIIVMFIYKKKSKSN